MPVRFSLRPVFALLTALILGIVAASVVPLPLPVLLAGMAVLLILSVLPTRQFAAGKIVCLLTAFALFGMFRAEQATRVARDDVSRLIGGPSLWICGTIDSAVESKPSSFGGGDTYSFVLDVQAIDDYQQHQTASGRLKVAAFAVPTQPQTGDRVWVRGKLELPLPATNPDGFDYKAFLYRQGIHATLAARREGDVRRIGRATVPPLTQAASAVRGVVERRVRSHMSPDDAALLLGMLLSERSRVNADLVDAFTRTGTVHILSVSGMHVAVVAALLLWLFRTLTVPKKAAHALCIPAIWLFALAASGGGSNPPAFRAALCATIFLLAPLLRRNAEPRHSLAFAALVLLIIDPLTLFDPGAQLSFATVGTILIWGPVLERLFYPWEPGMRRPARFSRAVICALCIGIVAHLGSWPLAAFYFHQFSVVAPLANIPVSLLADSLLVSGLLCCAVPFLPWWLIAQGLSLLRIVALSFAAPSWAAFSVAAPPAPLIFAYYLLVGGLAAVARHHILAPRRLFTPAASSPVDMGDNSRNSPVPAPNPDLDTTNRIG